MSDDVAILFSYLKKDNATITERRRQLSEKQGECLIVNLCTAPELTGTDYDVNQSVLPHYSLYPSLPVAGEEGAAACTCLQLIRDRHQPGL